MSDKAIMYDSDEAASYKTNISGWVSRNNHFYGDRDGAEHLARYDGCTHKTCGECGNVMPKSCYIVCDKCRMKSNHERYIALPIASWDGKSMLYSHKTDRYYSSIDDIEENYGNGDTLESLEVVICEPHGFTTIDEDYFVDDLPEDFDLPDEIKLALNAFNEALIEYGTVAWFPGKTRLI